MEQVILMPYFTKVNLEEAYLFLVLFEVGHHDIWLVVNCEDYFSHTSLRECFNLVANNWLVAKVDARLGEGEGHRPESRAEASDEDQSFH